MDTDEPRVTVVMITRNRRDDLSRSLEKVTGLPERPRVIVVDNGSDDGSPEAAGRFPRVEVIRAGRNLGASARNLGLRRAETPYVALSDDDTWWEPGCLCRAADLLDAHPRLAVAVARVLVGSTDEEDPICRVMADSPLPAPPGLPGPPLLGFLAGALVVRRTAVLDAGGFEPRFFIGGEEELLTLDLAAAGWHLCYIDDLVVHHHPSPVRDGVSRKWLVLRNALWCAWLRRPLSVAAARTLRAVRSDPSSKAVWRGLASALAGLPWVLRRRRVVPEEVERGLRLLEQGFDVARAEVPVIAVPENG